MTGDYQELLRALHVRTVEGKVNWQRTSSDVTFVVYFQGFSVTVKPGNSNDEGDYIVFILRDDAGKVVDQFFVYESEDEYDLATQMYWYARRRALKIDIALKTILGELSSGKVVGNTSDRAVQNEDDEEVPF